MAGRAQAFSDDTVIALTGQHFIPVAENCSPLQRQKDAKGDFFRLVAEQGHYAGRTYPTGTRQGYYALTADGTVLAAANSRDPQRMTELLQTALQRWSLLSGDGAAEPRGQAPAAYEPANPDRYPADGLVLRLTARDLPREEDTRKDDWRKNAWNMDYAWITGEEAAAIVPGELVAGARREVPAAVLRRLARFHLRDFVRGEPSVWPAEALREGSLEAEVVDVVRATGPASALRCGASGVGGTLGASREPGAAQLGYGVRREAGGGGGVGRRGGSLHALRPPGHRSPLGHQSVQQPPGRPGPGPPGDRVPAGRV